MAKREPLKVVTKIVREDGIVLYDDLTAAEKAAFAKRMNERAIRALAQVHGYTVEFTDEPPPRVETA